MLKPPQLAAVSGKVNELCRLDVTRMSGMMVWTIVIGPALQHIGDDAKQVQLCLAA